MIPIFAAAVWLFAVQADPQAPKTVEERLKELEGKLTALEKRHQTLELENRALELQIAERKAAREAFVKQAAHAWVQRFSKPLGLTEAQTTELDALWLAWTRSDLEKPADPAGWKSREDEVRGKLAPDQIPHLARAIRDDQEKRVKMSLRGIFLAAKIQADHQGELEKAVLGRLTFREDALLPQAHPDTEVGWTKILGVLEACLPDLAPALGPEETQRVRDLLAGWKPRK